MMASVEEWKCLDHMGLPMYSISTGGRVKNDGTKHILKGRKMDGIRYHRLKKIDGTYIKTTSEELMKIFDTSSEILSDEHDKTQWRFLDIIDLPNYSLSTDGKLKNVVNDTILKGRKKQGGLFFLLKKLDGEVINTTIDKLMKLFDTPKDNKVKLEGEQWKSLNSIGLSKYAVSTYNHVRNDDSKRLLKGRKGGSYFRLLNDDGTHIKITIEELIKVFDESNIVEDEVKSEEVEEEEEEIKSEDEPIETWKSLDFLSFSKYEVSDQQHVRNVQTRDNLAGSMRCGRKKYFLTNDRGKQVRKARYNLMKYAFDGIEEDKTVDHINRIPDDDRLSNLRYATKSEQAFNRRTPTRRKKVIQQFKDGIKTRTFVNCEEAVKSVNGNRFSILNACYKEIKYKGYEWCYVENIDLPDEIWKDGTERFPEISSFLVSNLGRIRRKSGTTIGCKYDSGHLYVYLLHIDGSSRHKQVNRLICGVFSDGRIDDLQVNHIDGNKENNKFSNLEYATGPDNIKHALDTGLMNTRIPVCQYSMSNEFITEFISMKKAYDETGVHASNIASACKGKIVISAGGYIWKYTDSAKAKKPIARSRSSPVNQIDEHGNIIATFSSISKAASTLTISATGISHVCHGHQQTSGGCYFRFVNREDENRSKLVSKPLHQLTLDGKFIDKFPSVSVAALKLNMDEGGISRACRLSRVYKNFRFKYI
uniref:HNH endonuclease n=1 Tax=Pithovirus LCPAC401 TaxID=2506595 RepID=A0A481Z9F4_9VIRU|nr:MAG: HNH endonuclease [Pithovirus LCPAC401]